MPARSQLRGSQLRRRLVALQPRRHPQGPLIPPFPFRTAASRSSAARLVRCPPPPCAFAFDELVIFHCYGAAFRIAQRPGRWTLNQDLGRAPRRLNPLSCAQVVALNESVPGSVKAVFKPWEQRLDTSGVCTDAVPCPLVALILNERRVRRFS